MPLNCVRGFWQPCQRRFSQCFTQQLTSIHTELAENLLNRILINEYYLSLGNYI